MESLHNVINDLLDDRAVARAISVSPSTVRRWRLLRQGPRYLKIGASVRYRLRDVQAWLESRPTGGEQGVPECQA